MTIHRLSKWGSLALVMSVAACGASNKKASGPGGHGTTGNEDLNLQPVDAKLCDTSGKKVALYDLNQDGKPDVWKLSADAGKGEVITCKQVDLDHDGKKDFVTHYDETGKIVLEEYDFDFDGKFDARIYFDPRTGKRYAAERTSGYGDKVDVWEKYGPDEMLEAVRRDRNGDGKPDYWEQYLGGVLDKILYDDNLDGVVDRKEEARAGQGSGISASVTPAPLDAPPTAPTPTPSMPAPAAKKETSRPEPPMEPGEKEEPPAPDEEK